MYECHFYKFVQTVSIRLSVPIGGDINWRWHNPLSRILITMLNVRCNVFIIFGNVHFPFSSSVQKRFIVNNAGVINLIFRSTKLEAHLTHGRSRYIYKAHLFAIFFLSVSSGLFYFIVFIIYKLYYSMFTAVTIY